MDTSLERVEGLLFAGKDWLFANVLTVSSVVQIFVLVGFYFLARTLVPRIRGPVETLPEAVWVKKYFSQVIARVIASLKDLILPVTMLIGLWLLALVADCAQLPHHLISSIVGLLTAWVLIRLMTTVVANPSLARALALIAWSLAALNLLGLLDDTLAFLDSLALNLGGTRLSLLGVGKGILAMVALLWVASVASGLAENRFKAIRGLTPSAKVLFGKLSRIALFTVAILLALQSIGIDLTAFAVFGGAIGLGIGFGLQKVFSNLISGVILLLDKSVKPGDVIVIGNTYGEINSLGTRCVSVITRDGTEHLIPNEELISQRVENWSYSNTRVRQRIQVGIDYSSDVHKARDLIIEAASVTARVLPNPAPVCHLKDFGDNAIVLEARVWIDDPQNGTGSVRSALLFKILELFEKNDIHFPYPQRDLHIKQSIPLTVKVEQEKKTMPRSRKPTVAKPKDA